MFEAKSVGARLRSRARGSRRHSVPVKRWLLASSALVAVSVIGAANSAHAQSIWNPGTTNDYNTAANWSNNNVPDNIAENATFVNVGQTNINVSANVNPNSWGFSGNAQAYTISSNAGVTVTLGAGGITSLAATNITISSVLAGAGFVQVNSGTLTLANTSATNNSYAGGTVINGGTLVLNSATPQLGAAGTAVTFGGAGAGVLQFNFPSAGFNRPFVLNQNGTINTNGNNVTVLGQISGTGALIKNGAGVLTLTNAANNYTGGTTINGGVVLVDNNNKLGGGDIRFSGGGLGVLRFTADFSSARNVTLLANGTIDTQAFNATLSGALTGNGMTLTKSGTGTLELAGNAAGFTNGIINVNGTLRLNTFSTLAASTQIVMQGSVLDYANGENNAAPILLTGATTQLQVLVGTATQTGAITDGGGAWPIEKIGAGTLILAGANTYTGDTTVTAGNLTVNGSITSNVINNAFFINNGTVTGNLTGTGSAINTGTLTGNVTHGNSFQNLGGTITGTLTQTAGASANAAGTINGLVTIMAGTMGNTGTLAGGLTNFGTFNAVAGAVNGTIQNPAGLFNVTGNVTGNGTFANSGTGQLLVTGGGTFTGLTSLTNTSTAAFGVDVGAGSTLTVSGLVTNGNGLAASTIRVQAGGTLNAGGLLNRAFSVINNFGTINDDLDNAGTVNNDGIYNATVNTNTGAINNNATGEWTGNITSNASSVFNAGTWTGNVIANTGLIVNAGTWAGNIANAGTFQNAGTVTGTLTQTAGGFFENLAPLGTINGLVTMAAGTTMNNSGTLAGGLTNSGTFNALGGAVNGTILNQGAGTFTVSGNTTGNGTFTNTGTAQLLLTGGNFTGITTLTNTSTAAIGVDVGAGSTLTVSGLVTNGDGVAASTIRVQAGGILNAGGLLNQQFSVVNNFGTINDVLDNAGLINNNGIWNATVNTNTGTINNNAAGVWTGDVNSNAGTIINAGTWTTTGPAGFNNSAGDLITTNLLDATLGGLTNRGQASASGEIRGAITNTDAGTFVVTGALLGNSSFTNSGTARLDVTGGNFTGITTLTNSSIEPIGVLIAAGRTLGATTLVNAAGAGISNSGTLTITGQITNSGTITVTATGSMTAAGITNNLGGTITNFGTVIDDLDNAGLINNNGIWIATVNTNSGTINNNATGTWTGNVTSSAGTIVNSGIWNGNVISNTGTLTNNLTWTGNITSSGTFSNAATGTVTGNLTNSGTASNTGTITGSVTNTAGTFTQTAGSVGGGLTNSATVNANGGAVNGVILNQGAGTFTVGGNVTGNNSFTNSGTAQLAVTGGNFTGITTLTNTSTAAVGVNVTGFTLATSGLVTNGNGVAASTMQVGAGGTLTAGGGFQNNFNSTINLTAATSAANGNLANGGTVTNAGTWTGNVTSNGGTITNNNIWTGAAINATGLISNTGTWTTTPGGFTNGSNFFNTGTLNATTGGMTNTGTALVSGTINGAIANNTAGIFQVTGGALSTTGSFSNNNSAELRLINSSYAVTGPIANNNTATINLLAPGLTLSSTTTVTNAAAAAINMNAGTLVGTAGITNAGTINLLTGANALGGNVTNSGVLALGTTTTTVGITGSLTGNAGNSITVPINLTTGVAASVAATGAATGTNNVVFGVTGGGGLFAPTVITTTAGGSGTFAGTGLPAQVGLVNYAYTAVGPNQTVVTAVPAAAAVTAPMTSILGTLSSVETSFHQSASALVASPQSQEPNKWSGGVWSRGSGGYSNVTSNGTASLISPLGVFSTQSSTRIDTRFAGYQVGLDGALLNVGNSGWNAHLGVTAGDVEAKSNDLFSSVNFTSGRFVGVYAVFTRGAFFSDIGYRHTSYDAEVTSSIVNLSKASLKGRGDNINASAGYQFRFGDHFIEPSAGISVTRSTFDSINGTLPIVGNPTSYTLAFNELKSTLARIGVRAGFTSVVQNTVALSPFVTGSVWREFEQNAGGQFIAISSVPVTTVLTTALTTDRVGTFYQAGAGVSAQVLNTGFLAFVRGDFRIGNKLDAASLHAGARYTFGP